MLMNMRFRGNVYSHCRCGYRHQDFTARLSNAFSVRYRLTNSQTLEITTEPSPTEEATRLTDPARTSPTAKTPGSEVEKGEGGELSLKPVITKPFLSRLTRPESHSVLGAAPTMMNSARVSTTRVAPDFLSRMVSASRWSAPFKALTSALYSIVILESASSRLER